MLVLNRKFDETIRIGNDIVIRICQIKGGSVRLGIDAPPEIQIMRGELPDWSPDPDKGDIDETVMISYRVSVAG